MTLRWKNATRLPVEAETLKPETLGSLSALEVSRLPILLGNTSVEIGELFSVDGCLNDSHLIIDGHVPSVRGIGTAMASGRITVLGDVGPRLAVGMRGGEIDIKGSVGVWAGAEMLGGLLRISGDAGYGLGSALPGSRVGMRDGVILVEGSVGDDAGLAIRRGLIAVRGCAGAGLGRAMIAGSIFTFGAVGELTGMGMKRGTLALFGLDNPAEPNLLPTFAPSGRDRPHFVTIYLKQLQAWGFDVPKPVFAGQFARYNGDRADRGQGEVLIWG